MVKMERKQARTKEGKDKAISVMKFIALSIVMLIEGIR